MASSQQPAGSRAGDGWSPPCWSCFSPSPPRLRPILADRPRSCPCFPWEVGRERSFRQPSGGGGWRVLVNSGSTPAVSGQPFSACGTRRVPNLKRGPSRTPGTSRCSCSACGSRWIPPLNRAPRNLRAITPRGLSDPLTFHVHAEAGHRESRPSHELGLRG